MDVWTVAQRFHRWTRPSNEIDMEKTQTTTMTHVRNCRGMKSTMDVKMSARRQHKYIYLDTPIENHSWMRHYRYIYRSDTKTRSRIVHLSDGNHNILFDVATIYYRDMANNILYIYIYTSIGDVSASNNVSFSNVKLVSCNICIR